MTLIAVDQSVPPYRSYAATRTRGLYNVDVDDGRRFQLKVDLPLEANAEDWKIGAIVGPSGSGKSSIVRELVANGWREPRYRWPGEKPIIEVLGARDYAKATAALAAVGLGSVPSWLRPRLALSTGEGFRADMARLLLSSADRVVLDEFTSVLDRQVAQVAAGAFAKSWRRGERKLIVSTCHYDVLDWLQPDWWVDTAAGLSQFEDDREVVPARVGHFPTSADRAGYSGDWVGTVVV